MKAFTLFTLVALFITACGPEDKVEEQGPTFENKAKVSFMSPDNEDADFSKNTALAKVECSYDEQEKDLQFVAYRYTNEAGNLNLAESLQVVDTVEREGMSGFLKVNTLSEVPAFVYLKGSHKITSDGQSSCSTYYSFDGDEITGHLLCSNLNSRNNDEVYLSLEFQCKDQRFLNFEIKKEML